MLLLTIYSIIFSIIIFKGFYKSIPFMTPFSVQKSTEFLSTSIQIESLPFYINQGKINLFTFFLIFFFLSFINLNLLSELIFNHTAHCMDEEADDIAGSSIASEESDFQINPDSFILSENAIIENMENEYERIFKKNIKYTGYLGDSSKNFSNNYNFKIFREINNEIDILIYKKQDIFKTISYENNPEILNIQCKNFIEILDNLNYNCHKIRFIFLKSHFDVIESKIEENRFKNWVEIFSKIDIFQEKSLPIFIINDIFDFFFDRGICNNFDYLINFINYLNFLIDNNEYFINILKENDPEIFLSNLDFVEKISYDYKPDSIKNKKLELNKDLLPFFELSANYLSESTEDISIDNLLIGETYALFENRLKFLSYFKEYKRSQNEILSNNDVSINKRNLIIFKNSVFYGKTDIKSYLIENNFDKNTVLNNNTLNFSENFEKATNTTKKYFFENEEKSLSLKRLRK